MFSKDNLVDTQNKVFNKKSNLTDKKFLSEFMTPSSNCKSLEGTHTAKYGDQIIYLYKVMRNTYGKKWQI